MRMRHKRFPRWGWVVAGLIMVFTVTVPAANWLLPHVLRYRQLNRLLSEHEPDQQFALAYIAHYANDNPRVLRGTLSRMHKVSDGLLLDVYRALNVAGQGGNEQVLQIMLQRMSDADDANFARLSEQVDLAGYWSRPTVTDVLWLRRLALSGSSDDPQARILAAEGLASLPDLAGDPAMLKALTTLSNDADAAVRLSTLVSLSQLLHHSPQREPYERLIAQATRDGDEQIARDAWLVMALIDPVSGLQPNWRQAPPTVAQAILYAALRTNPNHPAPAIEALNDPDVDPSVSQFAAYTLSMSDTAQARAALLQWIRKPVRELTPQTHAIVWRAILSIRADEPSRGEIVAALQGLMQRLHQASDMKPLEHALYRDLVLAIAHRLGELGGPSAVTNISPTEQPLIALAMYEAMPAGSLSVTLPEETPDMVRLAAMAAMRDPSVDDLKRLFHSEEPTLRDLACIVATQRLSAEQKLQLATLLLKDFNDDAKRSGAMLAGLNHLRPIAKVGADQQEIDLLTYIPQFAPWDVNQIIQLALWMQNASLDGENHNTSNLPRILLTRDDLPATTILLAMLHRGDRSALDYLLDVRHPQPADLIELLTTHRWSRVLYHHLPEHAPPLWSWADLHLQQFQIDLLRVWYRLHTHEPFRQVSR